MKKLIPVLAMIMLVPFVICSCFVQQAKSMKSLSILSSAVIILSSISTLYFTSKRFVISSCVLPASSKSFTIVLLPTPSISTLMSSAIMFLSGFLSASCPAKPPLPQPISRYNGCSFLKACIHFPAFSSGFFT